MQKRYIVDGNLKHDTSFYTTNDVIVMEEEQAAPLVSIGRLKPADEDVTPPQAPTPAQPTPPVPDGFPQHAPTQPPALQPPAQPPAQTEQPKTGQPSPEEIAATAAEIQ
jgi:hypothetical protein